LRAGLRLTGRRALSAQGSGHPGDAGLENGTLAPGRVLNALGGGSRPTRGCLASAVFAGGLYAYTVIQDLALPEWRFGSAWDEAIPFVPGFVFVYLLFFPYVVLASFLARSENFSRFVVAGVLAALSGWVCFLFFPASLERPDPAGVSGALSGALLRWLHAIDDSHNTFPSLHVAVTWIACLGFRGTRCFLPALAAAVAISASTLFVKQHTLLDVAGGLALAAICLTMAGRVIPRGPAPPGPPRAPLGRAR
jgi:membrane-associated phospholipid phosphatase